MLRGKGVACIRRPIRASSLRKSWFLVRLVPRSCRLTRLKKLSVLRLLRLLLLLRPRAPLAYRAQLSQVTPRGAQTRLTRLIVFRALRSRAQDAGGDAQLRTPRVLDVLTLLL